MNEQLEIRVDGILQEPSAIERLAEATVSHFTAAFTGLRNKVQDMADAAYKELDIADFDKQHGTDLYAQYKAQQRHDRITAKAAQYDIRPIRDAVGRYSLL